MQKIVPFLWFDNQAEEAVHFYTSVFPNSQVGSVSYVGDGSPGTMGKVVLASFQLAGQEFMALNGGPQFSFTPAISFFVHCQSLEQIDALWSRLSEGGSVLMEYQQYPFAEKFGWLADRYGVSWQLILDKRPLSISPCLMFVGAQHGRAEEAINFYTSLFKNSSVRVLEHYGADQGEPAHAVMHAQFVLDGQEFIAMDSGYDHQFSFTSATSFYVNCADQAEVDYFWDALSADGEIEMCGWLKDKFSVSWQIVPTVLGELMSDPDRERAGRVTQAMLQMRKLDISLLRRAYEQA